MNSGFFHKRAPELALLAVSFLWGITFPLGKYVMATVPVFTYMAIRFFCAAVLLYPFARRRLPLATAHDYKISAFIGLALFLAFAFANVGMLYTTASKTAVVNGLYAVLTPFFYFFIYRAPLKSAAVIASVLAFAGVAMLGVDFSMGFDWDFGVTLVLISSVFTALQIVGVGRYAVLIDPLVLTFFQTLVPALCCLLMALATESWPTEAVGFSIWFSIVFMAIFATVLGYFVQCRVQQDISHTVSAVIISTEGVFGALLAWIFLDEKMTPVMLSGCVLLVAAMLIAQIEPGGDAKRPTRRDG